MMLKQPLAIFDSGIGSYGVVEAIHKALPQQDILYLADRQSFPYGRKTRNELLAIMEKTIDFLKQYKPSGILIASNAPSILVLDELTRGEQEVPLFGVVPPLEEALRQSESGYVGILGVQSLVESEMLQEFISMYSRKTDHVICINASPMVELVENGLFQINPVLTQQKIDHFLEEVKSKYPQIDVFTLSSTHLPWLRSFFEKECPQCRFLDPIDEVVKKIDQGTVGSGAIQGLVTENAEYTFADFQTLFEKMGIKIPLEVVQIS